MDIIKKIISILIIIISIIGIAICLVAIFYSWSYNTPLTNALTGALTGVENFLTATDEGLGRFNTSLGEAQSAVVRVEEAIEQAGDTLSETNIAYEILDRTVGDELFPKVESIAESARVIAEGVVGFNAMLEAVNEIPLVEVPTLTEDLERIGVGLEEIRTDVADTKTELQEIKDEAIAKPVTAITERTMRIDDGLEAVHGRLEEAQGNLNETQASVAETKSRVPRTIDLISLALTLFFGWFILAQASLLLHALGAMKGQDPLAAVRSD